MHYAVSMACPLSRLGTATANKSKHHAEWAAEQDEKPTWRSLVQSDVDTAIRQSMTERQFFENLQKAGYTIKIGKDIH